MTTELEVRERISAEELSLTEKVVLIRRVAKVVKGGRHLRFNALVVVGDGQGHVGVGMGKAGEVPEAVRKGNAIAKRSLLKVPMKGNTIPHEIEAKFGAALVFLKPASPGTGIVAGGGVRAVLEQAGIKDIISKSKGSPNPINVVKATLLGLSQLRDPQEAIAARKGLRPVPKAEDVGKA